MNLSHQIVRFGFFVRGVNWKRSVRLSLYEHLCTSCAPRVSPEKDRLPLL